jgi:hypothetical protein
MVASEMQHQHAGRIADDALSKRIAEGTRNAASVASTLPGLEEADARSRVEATGCVWRVIERDGEGLVVHADLRPYRINVTIVDGRITAAHVG